MRARGPVRRRPEGLEHQPGVATPQQAHLVLAAFDVTAPDRAALADLLARWTAASARLETGRRSAKEVDAGLDSGEAHELEPARLTITFGLGETLFDARFGLADRRPTALRELPPFTGDELDPGRSGGDLAVQACADDPQVAVHAMRTLTRIAAPTARPRWAQTGFLQRGTVADRGHTPRNLLGFREGAANIRDPRELDRHVWIDTGDRTFMRGGTYLVYRRIRLDLNAWDATPPDEQAGAIGRAKVTGARHEPPRPTSHVALSQSQRLLRRSYNFFDGVDPATKQLDAGLLLICFCRDPRRQFVPLQRRLAEQDALSPYAVHTASAVFAVPPALTAATCA